MDTLKNTYEFVSQIYCAKGKNKTKQENKTQNLMGEPNFEEGNGLAEREILGWPLQ